MERGVIVAGYNGHSDAGVATLWAAAEAASRGFSLTILYAAGWPALPEPPLPPPIWPIPAPGATADHTVLGHAQTRLAAIANECHEFWPHLPVRTEIVLGPPAHALCDASADAYLLTIGPTSTPHRTTRSVRVDGQPPGQPLQPDHRDRSARHHPASGGRVVVGIDGSPTSTHAAHFAYDYAARHGCELVAVHAWPDSPRAAPARLDEVSRGWHTDWEHAEWLLTHHLATFSPRYPGVPVHRVVTRDRPASALRIQAQGATLLVIGSPGRRPRQPTAFLSVASTMLYRPPCTVALIDTPTTSTLST